MEDTELRGFSWSAMFIVTACCSFLFNLLLKLLDGNFSDLLLVVGGIAAFLGVVAWAGSSLTKQSSKKRRKGRFAP